jgi:transposase
MLSSFRREAMRKKASLVDLSADERQQLQHLIHGGTARARMVNRAQILLHADEGKGNQEIAAALHTSASTVWRIRKRFTEDGVHGALHEVIRPGGARKLTGEQEAYVIALACSTPPTGRNEWTMQLLADKVVALGIAETISDETIRRTLKRGVSSRGSASSGVSRQ